MGYDIRYSTFPINDETDFQNAEQFLYEGTPNEEGELESVTFDSLSFETTYYFAVKAYDFWLNISDMSNTAVGKTYMAPVISVTPNQMYHSAEYTEEISDTIALSNISEESYGDNIHGNLFEALIGAIFLDRGYPHCKKFIFDRVINPHVNLERLKNKIISYKSLFIEWCQKNKKLYNYETFEDTGNDTIKHFSVKLSIDDKLIAKARDTSKKKAEEKASKRAFFMFQEDILKYQNQNS